MRCCCSSSICAFCLEVISSCSYIGILLLVTQELFPSALCIRCCVNFSALVVIGTSIHKSGLGLHWRIPRAYEHLCGFWLSQSVSRVLCHMMCCLLARSAGDCVIAHLRCGCCFDRCLGLAFAFFSSSFLVAPFRLDSKLGLIIACVLVVVRSLQLGGVQLQIRFHVAIGGQPRVSHLRVALHRGMGACKCCCLLRFSDCMFASQSKAIACHIALRRVCHTHPSCNCSFRRWGVLSALRCWVRVPARCVRAPVWFVCMCFSCPSSCLCLLICVAI